jgi:hypothetical protein
MHTFMAVQGSSLGAVWLNGSVRVYYQSASTTLKEAILSPANVWSSGAILNVS